MFEVADLATEDGALVSKTELSPPPVPNESPEVE